MAGRESAFGEKAENPFLEAALSYADLGLAVFRLAPGTKVPIKNSGGFYDATTDQETISSWWTETPDANIGISCGASNVAVVDLDVKPDKKTGEPRDGIKEWEKWREEYPSDSYETARVITPSGGQHWYYRGMCNSTQNELAAGIDTKGIGGYVVAPPSRVGGKDYCWDPDSSSEFTDIPDPVARAAVPKYQKTSSDYLAIAPTAGSLVELIVASGFQLSRKGKEFAGPCPWCGGDDRFVVGWTGEGRDGCERYWCRQCDKKGDGVSWCVERLEMSVVEAKDARGILVPEEYRPIPAVLGSKDATTSPTIEATDSSVHPWDATRFTFEHFVNNPPTPTMYLVDKLFEAGALSVVSGQPGSLKTMFLLFVLLCVANGRDCLGRRVRQGPVAIIDLDNGKRRMHRRFNALARSLEIHSAPVFTYVFPPLDFTKPSSVQALNNIISRDRLVWVVADTLTNAAAVKDENDAAQFRSPLYSARRLVDSTGATLTMIHHPPKSGVGLRGSSAILGAVDEAIIIERPDQKMGIINISSIKSRGDDVHPFSCEWIPERDILGELIGGNFVPVSVEEQGDPDLQSRLLAELREGGDGGLNQLMKRLKCNKNNLSSLLGRLEKNGLVNVKPGPRNSRIYGLP